jgi:hypothetical protein
MRAVLVIFGVALAAGAGMAVRGLDASDSPLRKAETAGGAGAERLFQEALERDEASAYRWCDVGEAMLQDGQVVKARYCFRRALELAPGIPQIRVRDANFHFRIDEPEEGLRSAAKVLDTVPDYDAVLFSYFDAMVPEVRDVLTEIGGDRRVSRAYLQHLMAAGNAAWAEIVWAHLQRKNFTDEALVKPYLEFLVRNHMYDSARRAWVGYLGNRRGDYPERNLVYNGDFESEPTGALFDWRIDPSDTVDTRRDSTVSKSGRASLKIQFHGTQNVAYENARQTFYVTVPGRYRLTAWMRTDNITTNEGLRFRVYDPESPSRLEIRTEPVIGTQDWTLLNQEFSVAPGIHLVSISLVRNASGKFDSKINGTVWVDQVSVVTR